MPTQAKQFSDQTQLAATCRLIASFWLQEVDVAKLELLQDSQVRKAWIELGGVTLDDRSEPAATLDRLAADYCQLLIGPKKHLPPVQSVWADHNFQSVAASSTVRFYELFADYRSPGTIPDHLGCQLDFAAFLLDRVAHEQAAEQVLAQFWAEHLSWAGRLLHQVTVKADTEFYRSLATMTEQLIKELSA
jgi:TorA maturation chaperone TorD